MANGGTKKNALLLARELSLYYTCDPSCFFYYRIKTEDSPQGNIDLEPFTEQVLMPSVYALMNTLLIPCRTTMHWRGWFHRIYDIPPKIFHRMDVALDNAMFTSRYIFVSSELGMRAIGEIAACVIVGMTLDSIPFLDREIDKVLQSCTIFVHPQLWETTGIFSLSPPTKKTEIDSLIKSLKKTLSFPDETEDEKERRLLSYLSLPLDSKEARD